VPKEKILIADDEPDVLALCERILRSEGYDVTAVSNGLEAIGAAQQQRYDLFLTDIMMPGIKGLDAAQAIREYQPNIICVVMTGFGTMDTAIQALKLGFTEFVVKPFKPQDLKTAVGRAMEKERLRSENEHLNALVPLFELNKTLMSTVKEDDLARKALQTAVDELEADLGLLMLHEKDGAMRVRGKIGSALSLASDSVLSNVTELATVLLEQREQVLFSRRALEPSASKTDPRAYAILQALGVEHLLFNPLLAMDVPLGMVVLAKTNGGRAFGSVDRELLSVLCGQVAIAFHNARLFEETQRAYRDLQQLDHMKSEFINIAAHELRTPLAILMGHADLLEEDIQEPQTKNRLQIIVRNALRLRDLINDLLDMRHLQTAEARLNLSEFYVQDLIATALQDFRPMARKKGIEIEASLPVEGIEVYADREKVLIAFNNLVKNAIEFTRPGGRLGVEVTCRDKEVWLSVWDTGIGIPEDQLDKIFLPFHQVEDSLTREHEGMGLGLSIAKGMVELCGGHIWVESALGKGSRFTFSIPLKQA
jgi:two-component system phosphate regulon sensor histidine kinase PhoR